MNECPRPAIPFSFTKKEASTKELADGLEAPKPSTLIQDLIALLHAKGVGFNQIQELVPEAKEEVQRAKNSSRTSRLVNAFSAKLSESVETRIKKATALAVDKIMDILMNPKSTPKDILVAARDLLDRDLGKATQRVDIGGSLTIDEDHKTLLAASQAADERIKLMLEKREKVQAALTKRSRDSGVAEPKQSLLLSSPIQTTVISVTDV